ncbi:MAG: NifB/NifX family molybdenum-iron cluster-binding protein [Anaerolineae bacterium]
MRIAISADEAQGLDSRVSHHFGRCPYFVFVEIEEGKVQSIEMLPNPHAQNHSVGAVPAFIHESAADVMLAGGMGRRAIALFEQQGIKAYTGAAGTVRQALEQFLGGELVIAEPCRQHTEGHEHGHTHHHEEPCH